MYYEIQKKLLIVDDISLLYCDLLTFCIARRMEYQYLMKLLYFYSTWACNWNNVWFLNSCHFWLLITNELKTLNSITRTKVCLNCWNFVLIGKSLSLKRDICQTNWQAKNNFNNPNIDSIYWYIYSTWKSIKHEIFNIE